MRSGGLGVYAVLAVLGLSGLTPAAQAASGLEPGVHVDPGSPAAKEYALPLNQARQTGSEPSSQASSEGALFGAGIKPPGSGGSAGGGNGRRGTHPAAGGVASRRSAGTASGSQPALAQAVLRAERSSGSSGGEGSLLALLGGGVAILVLGGFGGTVLRHSRRPTPSP
jgi:hypothetical protein